MHDGTSCYLFVRGLVTWSGALTGLLMILAGNFIPSAILLTNRNLTPTMLSLPSSWQVPALMICALVSGPRSGVIAAIAYLTIGLFYLPIFSDGGSIDYLSDPGMGYLIGFIPAAWISGRLATQKGMNNVIHLTFCAILGLAALHFCGVLNIIIGSYLSRWPEELLELISLYSIAPLPGQIALCMAVGLISLILRRLLILE